MNDIAGRRDKKAVGEMPADVEHGVDIPRNLISNIPAYFHARMASYANCLPRDAIPRARTKAPMWNNF